MIELYTYKLINAVFESENTDVKYIDLYRNQYNQLEQNIRPFNQPTLFVEFSPRQNIMTRNNTVQYGQILVRYHILVPRPDNVNTKKKNINDSLKVFEVAADVNRIINTMDTSKYLSGTTVNNLILQESNYYRLESGHLQTTEVTHTDEFSVIILTFAHTYQDNSCFVRPTYSSGWTFTIDETVYTTPNSLYEGDFNTDFNTDFDLTSMEAPIFFTSVEVSGSTITISAYSYTEAGIPLDMEYCIDGINWQTSNVFTDVAAGSYNITIRNSRGDGLAFSLNPITVT
jgi:hypothetical protein